MIDNHRCEQQWFVDGKSKLVDKDTCSLNFFSTSKRFLEALHHIYNIVKQLDLPFSRLVSQQTLFYSLCLAV